MIDIEKREERRARENELQKEIALARKLIKDLEAKINTIKEKQSIISLDEDEPGKKQKTKIICPNVSKNIKAHQDKKIYFDVKKDTQKETAKKFSSLPENPKLADFTMKNFVSQENHESIVYQGKYCYNSPTDNRQKIQVGVNEFNSYNIEQINEVHASQQCLDASEIFNMGCFAYEDQNMINYYGASINEEGNNGLDDPSSFLEGHNMRRNEDEDLESKI